MGSKSRYSERASAMRRLPALTRAPWAWAAIERTVRAASSKEASEMSSE